MTDSQEVAKPALKKLEDQLTYPLEKVTLYCSLHEGKVLELCCETCGELICHNCTVSKHCRPEHKYELVADTFERHKSDITASLGQIDKQIDMLCKAVERLDVQLEEINDQGAAIEDCISQQMEQFHTLIEAKKLKCSERFIS